MWQALGNPRVLALAAIYFGIVTASVGLVLFAPQIIKQAGLSNFATGFVTSIPYIAGVAGMMIWGHLLGPHEGAALEPVRRLRAGGGGAGRRRLHGRHLWAVVAMCFATVGFYGSKGPFWSLPNTFLSGTAAAAGLAFINSVGNIGGWFGPTIVGWAADMTGSFRGGLYALAGFVALAAIMTVVGVAAPRAAGPRAARLLNVTE